MANDLLFSSNLLSIKNSGVTVPAPIKSNKCFCKPWFFNFNSNKGADILFESKNFSYLILSKAPFSSLKFLLSFKYFKIVFSLIESLKSSISRSIKVVEISPDNNSSIILLSKLFLIASCEIPLWLT